MDWGNAVSTWVAEGLITEEQAPALLSWLEQHAPDATPLSDVAITVVAMVAAWLLTGASVLFASQVGGDFEAEIALLSAVVWAAAGLAIGRAISEPAGQGLVASSVVIAPLALLALFETAPGRLDTLTLGLVLLPAVLGTGLGLVRRQTSLTVAASMAAAMVLTPWVYDRAGWAELVFGVALLGVTVPNLLAYRARHEGNEWLGGIASVLQSQVAFTAVIGINAAFARRSWGSSADAWLWESGFALTAFGITLLGAGAVGQSRMTLVSGVGALVTAEIAFLTAFGDVVAAIVILGIEGLALLTAVIAVVAARAGRARRDQAEPRRLSG